MIKLVNVHTDDHDYAEGTIMNGTNYVLAMKGLTSMIINDHDNEVDQFDLAVEQTIYSYLEEVLHDNNVKVYVGWNHETERLYTKVYTIHNGNKVFVAYSEWEQLHHNSTSDYKLR